MINIESYEKPEVECIRSEIPEARTPKKAYMDVLAAISERIHSTWGDLVDPLNSLATNT